ncbi:MAG: hybrid sensor histidine kinase/response regulator [Leptospiraceae bacterium]|nr:hybrid sensor histidine kinase/response regulator [Leptospiraceae bacterium]MCP5497478.1 hybrid sensor histidine kinase/response regulator [Leptospiraceae bacterium]
MNQTILVIDDNPKNIQVVAFLLSKENYEVEYALNGKDGLELLKELETCSLILLDITMPEMDGYEVCKKIREQEMYKDLPIIFLTAKTETEDILKGFDLGAQDYITKPFDERELLARVKNYVELKENRDKLKASLKQLEELNTIKDKFFSIVAHDIKNPFTVMQLATESMIYLFDKMDKEKLKDKLESLLRNIQFVAKISNNLLDWARSQSQDFVVTPERFDLKTIMDEIMEFYEAKITQKNIKIENKIQEPLIVYADREQIHTIFRNIISNALKFSHQDSTIYIKYQMCENDSVEVLIEDQGTGMNEDKLRNLYKIDKKQSVMGTEGEKGTGIGLFLVKDFVEKNHGSIRIESVFGKGTKVFVMLPTIKQEISL